MSKKVETGLIVVKDDVFTKIRRKLLSVFFKENKLMYEIYNFGKPKKDIAGHVIIPKEIKL